MIAQREKNPGFRRVRDPGTRVISGRVAPGGFTARALRQGESLHSRPSPPLGPISNAKASRRATLVCAREPHGKRRFSSADMPEHQGVRAGRHAPVYEPMNDSHTGR